MNVFAKLKIGPFYLPKSLCAGLTILSFYAIITGFISMFLPLIIEQIQTVISIEPQNLADLLAEPLTNIDEWLAFYQVTDGEQKTIDIIKDNIAEVFNISNVSNVFGSFVGTLGNFLVAVFSVTFIAFFFLIDAPLFYNLALKFVPRHLEKSFKQVVSTTQYLLTRYFVGVSIQITLITTLVTLGMLILGIPNALLIGFFAGVINIIPYLGPIIGMVFGIFVSLTTNLDQFIEYSSLLPFIFQVTSVFLIVQLLDNSLFQPIIFSNSIKAHPLEIFLLVWIAATFAGVGGMVLAIPCYTIIRVIANEVLLEVGVIEPPENELDEGM